MVMDGIHKLTALMDGIYWTALMDGINWMALMDGITGNGRHSLIDSINGRH
jgi:hypothetical protein